MQDRLSSYSQDSCFQKPAMRRALGELTNSPRTNSPRRALGELTNSPRLLDQHSPRFLSPIHATHATPTKEQVGPMKKSPAITPTHNLKLLTELAAKVAGGTSSARQTLQFEDIDTSRYSTEPVCLGGVTSRTSSTTIRPQITAIRTPIGTSHAAGNTESPHKDHKYTNKIFAAEYEPKDEVCEEYIKLEPTVTAEEARIETGLQPLYHPQAAKGSATTPVDKNNIRPLLPPLLPESALFVPPIDRGNRKDKSLGLLAERMLQNYPYAMGHGDCTEVQLDDTAKLLHTERRRIYDIVNVFEAVQMMSRVCKNVYRWHGRTYLVQSLAWLRQLGIKLGMQEQYRIAREQEIHDIENLSPLTSPRVNNPTMSPMMSPMMSPYGSPGMSPYGSPNDPCGTSMGINTQKFLMLFLVIPEQKKLTLDFAAKVIHGPNPNEKAKVTRVRRLYDIANILQALGLIRKVQISEGKSKKPAFEYVGPDVEHMQLTDEEKKRMPSARQKNSLLAVGKNLAQLPDKDESAAGSSSAYALAASAAGISGMSYPGGSCTKRARSLSDEHRFIPSGKLVRTHSESRIENSENSRTPGLSASSLLQLGEVCQREREMLDNNKDVHPVHHQDQENLFAGGFSGCSSQHDLGQENNENINQSFHMKPPTPGRAPSRKKVLLQRYYSDSQLQLNSKPTPHNFISPSPVTPNYGQSLLRSPRSFAASSRPVPFPSPLALKSSPMTPKNTSHHPYSSSSQKPQSPRQHTGLRSPITPRDMRNSAILPPSSPVNNRMPNSPMGPVGRSLLASPASPRSPMDLSLRTSAASFRYHGKSPLASRSLNLPPSPVTSNDSASQSPKPLQLLSRQSSSENLSTSPLLRAYLANNKSNNGGGIFRPLPDKSNNITVIGLLSDSSTSTTPPQTPSSKDRVQLADTELEGIYRLPNTSVSAAVAANHQQHMLPAPQSKPEALIKLPSIETPMDFSRLLANCQPRMGGLPRPADGLPRPRAVLGSSLMSPNFASSQDRY